MTTTITGDAGIDKVQPGSIVQEDLAANVAGTGPCFSAYPSVAQAFPATTETKVLFQLKEFDTSNALTNSRFQPTVSGYYLFTAALTWTIAAGSYISFAKNNVSVKYTPDLSSGNRATGGSAIIYLNGSSDYVEVYLYISSAQSLVPVSTVTYFQGCLVRAA